MKIKLSKKQWENIGNKTGWIKQAQIQLIEDDYEEPLPAGGGGGGGGGTSRTFFYYINLSERGYFEADVRNQQGRTVFEIKAGNSLGENETSIFEEGWMRNSDDISGLKEYLIHLGIMNKQDDLLRGN